MTVTLEHEPATVAQPLRGRTALVTGGATGIGAAIVRALSRAGAAVAIGHLSQHREATGVLWQISATTAPPSRCTPTSPTTGPHTARRADPAPVRATARQTGGRGGCRSLPGESGRVIHHRPVPAC
jgi:NAD(P)-dependent dehydrogenase (short-subunit alcohol dehydrogenase family)